MRKHAGDQADEQGAPPAIGMRLPWSGVPADLARMVESHLGAPVAEATTQTGGFSPGVAARLRLADGRRVFAKAVGPRPNPDSPILHRAEGRIAARLPLAAPAPRLIATFEAHGWVVLVFEDVDGAPPDLPWKKDQLDRVLAALADLAAVLTPSPLEAPTVVERFGEDLRGWRRLAAGSPTAGRAPDATTTKDDLETLDPWACRHLDALADLETRWTDAATGDSLVHADLRADNLLLTPDRVVVVDWPWACAAAPWFDLLAMLPSVRMQGGPAPEDVFDVHPVARGADADAVTATIAALAGFFVRQSLQPAPPGLPTLRPFQAAQGRAALDWLRIRTGWS
ncbi:aminoglycoside phosphotransferase [Parafrankia colletiae]|uniref:Aminoglycoside phosphotransferase n=1 Tax=Parafrankia colletiae TaxID=573497 RepID=A0A1S1QH37_9ACTN|nr:phosphotransferase [Parafrankia colletiae]MCK9901956.1 aminoglycoside phosphotransferase family protein [Frankia sp. Cpl3]OHV32899.1 aminoglycoside phosphotransferase [Parafrankia colletiae]